MLQELQKKLKLANDLQQTLRESSAPKQFVVPAGGLGKVLAFSSQPLPTAKISNLFF